MVYNGNIHPELRTMFSHTVTITKNSSGESDIWGNPIPAEEITEIPALWLEEIKVIAKDDNTKDVIVSYVTCYLPPDLELAIGDIVKFGNKEKPILQLEYPEGMEEWEDEFPVIAWL